MSGETVSRTAIPSDRLRLIREAAHAQPASPFVDPAAAYQAKRAIRARGRGWAAAVLGRDLSRNSAVDASLPWLRDGELAVLVQADREEDAAVLAGIEAATSGVDR